MVMAARGRNRLLETTLLVEEPDLRLAVAQFLRSRGVHATHDGVRFRRDDGRLTGETVAEVTLRREDDGRPRGP